MNIVASCWWEQGDYWGFRGNSCACAAIGWQTASVRESNIPGVDVCISLLFDCYFAKFTWRILHVSFNLIPPTSIHNMFTCWLQGLNRKLKSHILVGASAFGWALWLTRNNIVFDKVLAPSYLQIIFRGTYWIRSWSQLQKEEDRQMMKMYCRNIETTTMEVFSRHGWRFSNRIGL